jgi:predicted Zn-dependent protease
LECVGRCFLSVTSHINIAIVEEVKAVQIISTSMRVNPQSYTLLHVQCDFLRSKGKYDWALKLARQAVNSAPSEFVTWEKLTELYIDLGDYESVCFGPSNVASELNILSRHYLP